MKKNNTEAILHYGSSCRCVVRVKRFVLYVASSLSQKCLVSLRQHQSVYSTAIHGIAFQVTSRSILVEELFRSRRIEVISNDQNDCNWTPRVSGDCRYICPSCYYLCLCIVNVYLLFQIVVCYHILLYCLHRTRSISNCVCFLKLQIGSTWKWLSQIWYESLHGILNMLITDSLLFNDSGSMTSLIISIKFSALCEPGDPLRMFLFTTVYNSSGESLKLQLCRDISSRKCIENYNLLRAFWCHKSALPVICMSIRSRVLINLHNLHSFFVFSFVKTHLNYMN